MFPVDVTAIREVTTQTQQEHIQLDSLFTLQALLSKLIKSKTVILCHEALYELAKHNTVHIKWSAVHVEHWGNERADELAKKGTTITSLVKGYIPQSHNKAMINQKVNLLDQVEWKRNGHCHTNTVLGNKHKHTIKRSSNRISSTEYSTELPSSLSLGT